MVISLGGYKVEVFADGFGAGPTARQISEIVKAHAEGILARYENDPGFQAWVDTILEGTEGILYGTSGRLVDPDLRLCVGTAWGGPESGGTLGHFYDEGESAEDYAAAEIQHAPDTLPITWAEYPCPGLLD